MYVHANPSLEFFLSSIGYVSQVDSNVFLGRVVSFSVVQRRE